MPEARGEVGGASVPRPPGERGQDPHPCALARGSAVPREESGCSRLVFRRSEWERGLLWQQIALSL